MGAQNILHGLLFAPTRTIAVRSRPWKTILVSLTYFFAVLFGYSIARDWILEEESVMSVTCWMRLRLEQSVEVPEGTLNESVRWHLVETHLYKYLSELGSNFQ